MKKTIVLVVLMTLSSFIGFAVTVDEIIQKHLTYRGGVEKLKSVKSIQADGKAIRGNMEMKLIIRARRPDKIHVQYSAFDKEMVNAYDGRDAWQITASEPPEVRRLTGPAVASLLDTLEILEDPIIDYKKKGLRIQLSEIETVNETPAYKLLVVDKKGRESYYYIHGKTDALLKTVRFKSRANGVPLEVATVFSEYKPVDGIVCAHKRQILVDGEPSGDIVFDTIRLNVAIDDKIFKMPEIEQKTGEGVNNE